MRISLVMAAMVMAAPAMAEDIRVASRVVAATVFPDGAVVMRLGAFEAPEGRHRLVITDVPAGFDEASLRAEGGGDFTILSVEQIAADMEAMRADAESRGRKMLEAIEAYEDQIAFARNEIEAADRQLAFIDATIDSGGLISGEEGAPPRSEDVMTLWRGSRAAAKEALDLKRRAQAQIRDIERQLAPLRQQAPQRVRPEDIRVAIAVEIVAEANIEGSIMLSQFSGAASWGPVYDARLSTEGAPKVTLIRRAEVRQSTGEDWKDVALMLSTAFPQSATAFTPPRAPYIGLQRLNAGIMPPPPPSPYMQPEPVMMEAIAEADFADGAVMRKAKTQASVVRRTGETVVFDITARADIPSGISSRQVMVSEEELEASVEIRATPSQEERAYLYATFKNEGAIILEGEAALARDGVYIGRSALETIPTGGEAAIPFGAFEGLEVAWREIKREDAGESFGRPEKIMTARFELKAKNLTEKPRAVALYDALPQSNEEDVDVKLIADPDPSEQDAEDATGRLVWRFDLAPGAEQAVSFGYDVAYPVNAEIYMR